MSILSRMVSKTLTTKTNNEVKKKPNLFQLLVSTPEDFKLEAWVESEELIIKVKRKENIL